MSDYDRFDVEEDEAIARAEQVRQDCGGECCDGSDGECPSCPCHAEILT